MTDIIRAVDLEPGAAKLYRQLVKESYAELQSGGEITMTNRPSLRKPTLGEGYFLGAQKNMSEKLIFEIAVEKFCSLWYNDYTYEFKKQGEWQK
jgi:hypothetical protein